jgi:thiol-disulfide isomerase/thioredoxin
MNLNFLKNLALYRKFILILFIASIFIVTAIYVYRKYVVNRNRVISNKNIEGASNSSSLPESGGNTSVKNAELYLFYTDWCPHCKKAKPEWAKLKEMYGGNKKINGYILSFIEVDCEAEPDLANKFNVTGYPTIKLVKGNQIVEFDGKPQVSTLENFLSTVLK